MRTNTQPLAIFAAAMLMTSALASPYIVTDSKSDQSEAVITIDYDWQIQEQYYVREIQCLARNMYFEARGEGPAGQQAIALVTLNRTMAPGYPSTVCEVVHQGVHDRRGVPVPRKCQFSWYCDGRKDRVLDQDTFAQVLQQARTTYTQYYLYGEDIDFTYGATHFHAITTNPNWERFDRVAVVGNHVFYRTMD